MLVSKGKMIGDGIGGVEMIRGEERLSSPL
jgi:hypothetical protein